MTINWKNVVWSLRNGGQGGPGYGGWSENNVVQNPDGTLTIKLTNPSGTQPVGVELDGNKSLGYGLYTIVVEGQLNNLHKNIVLGNLFPYFGGTPYVELDVGEVSGWDSTNIVVSHTTYRDDGTMSESVAKPIDSALIHTFTMDWQKDKITYNCYAGVGTAGQNISNAVHTKYVPIPGKEIPIINLWVFSNGTPTASDLSVSPATFILRDFSFIPLGQPIPTPVPTPVPTPTPDLNKLSDQLTTALALQNKVNAIKTEIYGNNSTLTKVNNVKKLL